MIDFNIPYRIRNFKDNEVSILNLIIDYIEKKLRNLSICQIKTGTYTGDGAISQAITGIGFRPKYVKIWLEAAGNGNIYETTDTLVDNDAAGFTIRHDSGGGHQSVTNAIISLDSDGFTVDDAGTDSDPNADTVVYNYVCLG